MKNIISIDISVKDGIRKMCAIVLFDGTVETIFTAPIDYSIEDFLNVVVSESNGYLNSTIIFDRNGMGILFEDYFKLHGIENIIATGMKEHSKLPSIFEEAKNSLLELAMDSNLNSLSKTEFKKLVKEFNNLEPIDRGGRIRLNTLDESIDNSRAICYLNYYLNESL